MLELEQVRAGYAGSLVLTDLDLVVHEGEAVALLGRNGVGKTTMLRAITGTVQKSAGRITMDGTDITHAQHLRDQPAGHLAGAGRTPAVPQPDGDGQSAPRRAPRRRIAGRNLRRCFPKLRILQRSRAESLSGGERQMLAIARALMVPAG